MRELFDQEFSSSGSSGGFQRISPDWLSPEVMLPITAGAFRIKTTESVAVKQLSSVAFSRLRKFLESPLQSTASHLLGIAEDEEDVSEKVDEPLVLVR